jgi:hypothetical protein
MSRRERATGRVRPGLARFFFRYAGGVITGHSSSTPKTLCGPDEWKVGKRVRVVDASRATIGFIRGSEGQLTKFIHDIYLAEGLVTKVFVSGATSEYLVDIPGKGTYKLKDSEVKFL